MKVKVGLFNWFLLLGLLSLTACSLFSSDAQQVRQTTEKFWQALLSNNMETAKELSTLDSAVYLHLMSTKSLSAQRFEMGELQIQENTAEVATVLYGGEKGDMAIPLRTVLVRSENGWLVDVQKTLGSMVSGAMGAVVNQLKKFMDDGLDNLDKSLTDNVNKLNDSLQQGVEQLQKDLTTPTPNPSPSPQTQSTP